MASFSNPDQHMLPPDTGWAKPYRCRHNTVESADRADLPNYVQRCMCGQVVMGLRCPDCEQTY